MAIYRVKRYSADYVLENYEDLSDSDIKKLTDNQKKMLLEDERRKARRNSAKIIGSEARRGAAEGKERGKKSGTAWGAGIGAVGGGALGYKHGKAVGAAIGTVGGALAGAGLGRVIGGANGEASGYRKGSAKGRAKATREGHGDVDVMTRQARRLDDYARKHRGSDHWETDVRDLVKAEKIKAAEEAARRRAEELARRRVAAEEMKAKAADRDSRTNRDRYYDELFGRTPKAGTHNTQYNYYYR